MPMFRVETILCADNPRNWATITNRFFVPKEAISLDDNGEIEVPYLKELLLNLSLSKIADSWKFSYVGVMSW